MFMRAISPLRGRSSSRSGVGSYPGPSSIHWMFVCRGAGRISTGRGESVFSPRCPLFLFIAKTEDAETLWKSCISHFSSAGWPNRGEV
ncbi:hypothetical protein LY78DRAFT_276813 [Colletotrichum sublineola]|nr:hypothetical protein LY78DRAFT_276813 [Colletotrichum sublineola]